MRFAVQAFLLLAIAGCAPAVPPPTRETLHLRGSAYDRGLQHGQQLRSKVRSVYTTLLATSILASLNREHADLGEVFAEYKKPQYSDGNFSFALLLDSAKSMEPSIPRPLRDEMRGIADGSGMTYEEILVLNTFVDSLLSIRSVSQMARQSQSPLLERVRVEGLSTDGVDNDGDGTVDEADESEFDYEPLPHATRVDLPPDAAFTLTLFDPDGIDPATIRVTIGDRLYTDLPLRALSAERVEVTLSPGGLPEGAFAMRVQCGDKSLVTEPPPAHARFMRDEVLTFTTKGTALRPQQVPNRSIGLAPSRAPAFSFAARGAFTAGGGPLLAHQFALLDGNSAHKHTALFVHHPDGGEPFAVIGWAGMVWGMSGMNAAGLALACNSSDTLDNSVVRGLVDQLADLSNAKLRASGQPIGMFARVALERDQTAAEVVTRAKATPHTFGWACLAADAAGDLRGFETDSDFDRAGGVFELLPGDTGPGDVPLASLSADDLRLGSHFARNRNDMPKLVLAGQRIQPQSAASSFYFRSLAATSRVGDALAERQGALDAESAEEILRMPELVDPIDSMNQVVFEPAQRRMRIAMGAVPVTNAAFESFSFEEVAP